MPKPAVTITEVIARLDEIVKVSEKNSDRIGYFAALYKQVTVAVFNKLNEKNFFADNARMEKLDVVFANRFLEAFDNHIGGKPCSASWQFAFNTAGDWKPMVIHHLVLGMNAHIGLDLGLAAGTVAPGASVEDLHDDFNKINVVLGELVNEVKNDLFSMWPLGKLLSGMLPGKMEDSIAGFSMTIARDAAWQVALAYAPLNETEAKAVYIANRDKAVAIFGEKLIHPGFFLSTLMYIFRLFEFGSIAKKIRKLDG